MVKFVIKLPKMSKAEILHIETPFNSEKDDNSAQLLNVEDDRVRSKEERKVVLKQDLVILPLLAVSFFFAYLVSLPCPRRLDLAILFA